MEQNNKQDIAITKVEKDVGFLKDDIATIKKQVFNDIPHKICELKKEFVSFKLSQARWQTGFLVSIILLLIGIIINIIVSYFK